MRNTGNARTDSKGILFWKQPKQLSKTTLTFGRALNFANGFVGRDERRPVLGFRRPMGEL